MNHGHLGVSRDSEYTFDIGSERIIWNTCKECLEFMCVPECIIHNHKGQFDKVVGYIGNTYLKEWQHVGSIPTNKLIQDRHSSSSVDSDNRSDEKLYNNLLTLFDAKGDCKHSNAQVNECRKCEF